MTLIFYYGTMNSGKTANLIMKKYNYESNGKKTLVFKPSIDTRFGKEYISSRAIKTKIKADFIIKKHTIIKGIDTDIKLILVDEVQFLSESDVEMLRYISLKIPVHCYGLKTDFMGKLFEGSKRLIELADKLIDIESVCSICENKSIINAKFNIDKHGNKIIIKKSKNNIDIGSEDKYQSLCYKCWSNE